MKRKNRIRGLFICLLLLTISPVAAIFLGIAPSTPSLLFGFAAGWALRETLEPRETEE